ncbi:metallophosphoesterase family protein [Flavitalea sp.]|nr:metallophosphoesterase [Flavitalea sp.]
MIIKALLCIAFLSTAMICRAQDVSFIVLGDMHYDRLDDHDLDYVTTRPQDYQQIFNEYPQYTAFFMPKFLQVIKRQSEKFTPQVKAVVQLGDLTEGVSGNFTLATKMNRGVVDMMHSVKLPVPWVLVKGNHDVSNSPGQPQAWEEVLRPFMEGQVNKTVNHGMYTFQISDDVELFVLDQFFSVDRNLPETEMIAFLERELGRSKARHKFILTHQPVIPMSQRCWHLLSGIRRPVADTTLREKFLNLLAKHKAIVFCAHEHMYSVLSRNTASGPIVQVMLNSVNRGLEPPQPKKKDSIFRGEKWVDDNLTWQPATNSVRRKILQEEKGHIGRFSIADLPGYAMISIVDGEVIMRFFNGLSETPYEQLNLTALQKNSGAVLPGKSSRR